MAKQRGSQGQSRTRKKRSTSSRRKPFFLQRLRRRDIVVLIGLFSLACVSLITVAFLILRFQSPSGTIARTSNSVPGPQPTHTVTHTAITGLGQYALAEAEATAWAADAQLVSANANWPFVLSIEEVGLPSEWTYRFYSPGKERLFVVKVSSDGEINSFEHVVKITLPPPVLDTDAWLVDSPTALAAWLDFGGAELVRKNPGLEVLAQLRHVNNYDRPVWMVIGTDQRTQDIHVVLVDAYEGGFVPVDARR